MAAGPTYEPIATTTLGSSTSTITFSSIPATYTDLRLIMVAQTATVVGGTLTVNGSTSGYSRTSLNGNGSAASSSATTSATGIPLGSGNGLATTADSAWTMIELDFMSYAGSTYKTILHKWSNDKNGSGQSIVQVALWQSTSAITSINFAIIGMVVGTTATLYGIKAA
jgi:hypothetical protein